MKPPIKVENNGPSPAASNSLTMEDAANMKSELKTEIKVEEKGDPMHNVPGGSAIVVAKGIIPASGGRPPLTANIKDEEYDSSATVSTFFCSSIKNPDCYKRIFLSYYTIVQD